MARCSRPLAAMLAVDTSTRNRKPKALRVRRSEDVLSQAMPAAAGIAIPDVASPNLMTRVDIAEEAVPGLQQPHRPQDRSA